MERILDAVVSHRWPGKNRDLPALIQLRRSEALLRAVRGMIKERSW